MKRVSATVVAVGLGVTTLAAVNPLAPLNPLSQEARVPTYGRPPDTAQLQKPVFKSGVDLVTLDVSVLDDQRRPIRGLGPADFTILENGKPQQIAVFSAVDIPDVEPPKTAWLRDVAPDVRTNEDIKERRLFLIIVDDAMVDADVFALTQLKEQTKNVINKLGPSDLAAVVFTMDNRKSTDFTSDRARLLKTVETQPMGFRGMAGPGLEFTDAWYMQASVDIVRRAVDVLGTMPDRHRSIIYISSGVPLDLGLVAEPAALGLNGGASAAAASASLSQQAYLVYRAFQSSALGNVPVNTIDICGLRLPRLAGGGATGKQTCVDGFENEYLINVAVGTGGRAIVNTNDFKPGLDAIFQENASYYLIGYQSTDPTQDGKLRRLEVQVNRPNAKIKTRSGYVPEKPDAIAKRKAQLAEQPLGAALAGVLPKGDLPMRLTAAPFAIPGKKESSVLVMLGVTQPVRETGVRTVEKVDLQVRAYNTDGKMFGATNLRADVVVRAGATGLADYEVLARLDLKPGRYQLRTAANVGSLTTSGSLYYDVEVPDFFDAPVSLSGLVLTAVPALPSGGLKTMLPVAPTAQRTFGPGAQASAFLRVYQGGSGALAAVPLRIQLRNGDDVMVLDRQEILDVAAFSKDRSADVNVALPVARLSPGPYLLTMESTVGKTTARRMLRFDVVR